MKTLWNNCPNMSKLESMLLVRLVNYGLMVVCYGGMYLLQQRRH